MYGEPTIEQGHIDAALSDFGVKLFLENQNYVANQIAPVIPVPNQSGKYFIIDPREGLNDEHEEDLTYGQESTMMNFVVGQGDYATNLIGKAHLMPDGVVKNSDDAIKEEQKGVAYLANNQAIKRERRLARLIDDVTNFAAAGHHFAAALPWDNAAAIPKVDIDAGVRLIQLASGVTPTDIMFSPLAYDIFTSNAEVKELYKYQKGDLYLRTGEIGDVVYNLRVSKAGAIYDTTAPLETSALAFIWEQMTVLGDDWCLMFYKDPMPTRWTAGFAGQFVWNQNKVAPGMMGRLRRFRDEPKEGEVFDLRLDHQVQILNGGSGCCIHTLNT